MDDRLTPVELIFGDSAEGRFARLKAGLEAAGRDPRDRDGFVLVREVVELLRELAPPTEPGIAEGLAELVALLRACHLYWTEGRCRVSLGRDTLGRLLETGAAPIAVTEGPSYYLELPRQRVWGVAVEGGPPEPFDGCFVIPRDGVVEVVGVLGLQLNRDGFTVVEAAGSRATRLARVDGTALFSPSFDGGKAARLHQVIGQDELVELVLRVNDLVGAGGAKPGMTTVAFG